LWWCGVVVVWGVWGVVGVGVWWVRSNIPRSALCATLDTYNFSFATNCFKTTEVQRCVFQCLPWPLWTLLYILSVHYNNIRKVTNILILLYKYIVVIHMYAARS
jgi:hypothetical protein